MSLPLCPCKSGKLYEECCYKKKDSSGKPMFFKGAMTGDSKGNWHPLPNIRLAVIIGTQTIDKYRDFATKLAAQSMLPSKYHKDFINNYALFYQAYDGLLSSLGKSGGEGVAFQTDSIETRTQWKSFLLKGRILLDFIGLHSRESLNLDQDIGGLNAKKFILLITTLEKLGKKDKKFLNIINNLVPLREDILRFIDFRDEEKKPKDTIIEFPSIDSEYGIVRDGRISLRSVTFEMIKFIKISYEAIYKLSLILLDA
jgi:hypothetical protein